MNTALIQVLGAVAHGELKAYEGAKADAAATDEATRRRYRKVAAEELRHHEGFVARLEALGADPERAMRPYRQALDTCSGAGGVAPRRRRPAPSCRGTRTTATRRSCPRSTSRAGSRSTTPSSTTAASG